MNKTILVGRMVKEASMRQVNTSKGAISCAQFTVAVDRRFKDKDGNKQADFINCVAWRAQAEFIGKYFAKGSRIGITGTLQSRTYDDKDGKKVYVTEVLVEDVEFVESKAPSAPANTAPAKPSAPSMEESPADDLDLFDNMPFEI